MSNQETAEKYELDIPRTLISNSLGFMFLILIFAYVFTWTTVLQQFTQETTKLVAVIVFAFSTVKLVAWILPVNFEYKLREGISVDS